FPLLVVMRITPLAALAPYMAADASFNTEMDSMSLELILSQPGGFCTPSTTTRGLLSPVVLLPRIKISALSAPGSPERLSAVSPGTNPDNELVRLTAGLLLIS